VVQVLLKHHPIGVNIPDDAGKTPLNRVCMKGQIDLVRLLLEHDAVGVNVAIILTRLANMGTLKLPRSFVSTKLIKEFPLSKS